MSKRVLIVDDHSDTRVICRELLTHYGYLVEEAEDGASALLASAANRPDLVLLDFLMPERDGLQVLTELRSRTETALTPVVLYTAAAARLAELSAHPQVTRVLLKPTEAAELVAVVQELIGPAGIPVQVEAVRPSHR